jgi:hypothetical protein
MPVIRVRELNINRFSGSAGGVGVTQFSDTFNRASGPLGQNWAQGAIGITPYNNNVSIGVFAVNASNDATQSMGGTNLSSGIASTILPAYAAPIPLINNLVWGKSQHSQFTFKDYTSTNNSSIGIACCLQPSALLNCYALDINLHTPLIQIVKFAPNGQNQPGSSLNGSSLVGPINANALNTGDVIRLSVDFTTTPGSAIITVLINGVVKGTFTDVSPLVGGIPGIYYSSGNGTFHVINFVGGLGV